MSKEDILKGLSDSQVDSIRESSEIKLPVLSVDIPKDTDEPFEDSYLENLKALYPALTQMAIIVGDCCASVPKGKVLDRMRQVNIALYDLTDNVERLIKEQKARLSGDEYKKVEGYRSKRYTQESLIPKIELK